MTDRQSLMIAFKSLRKRGIAARMNFRCCTSCATAESPDDRPMVYWHGQDDDAFEGETLTQTLFIGFCTPDGKNAAAAAKAACEAIIAAGIAPERVEWDGSARHRIGILAAA